MNPEALFPKERHHSRPSTWAMEICQVLPGSSIQTVPEVAPAEKLLRNSRWV